MLPGALVRRRTTIADIAQQAGVSVGTVSNVLNSKGRHSQSTRQRVLDVAASLNYAPNALIRSLQTGRTNAVGVFSWRVQPLSLADTGAALLSGIAAGLAESRYDVLLYSVHPHEGEVPVSLFLDGRVDGLIAVPGGSFDDDLSAVSRAGVPTVALYQGTPTDGIAAVNIDNVSGVLAAIDHLAELGHTRIAAYTPVYNFDFEQRLKGYRMGLGRRGLSADPALYAPAVLNSPAKVASSVDRLLGLPDPPTAVLAGNDGLALAVLEELTRRGIEVPGDVSVVGFDDAPIASLGPGLTTVRQPAEEVGRTAGRFVTAMIDGARPDDCRALLPVDLVVRGTTGPPHLRGRHCARA